MPKKIFLIALLIILIDQISKLIAKNFFIYEKNFGATFGLFQGQLWLFILTAFIVIALILYYSKKAKSYTAIALGFLLGGTIGNLTDRIFLGYVIDFINIKIWPSFNIADIFNVLGVILIIIYLIKK